MTRGTPGMLCAAKHNKSLLDAGNTTGYELVVFFWPIRNIRDLTLLQCRIYCREIEGELSK